MSFANDLLPAWLNPSAVRHKRNVVDGAFAVIQRAHTRPVHDAPGRYVFMGQAAKF